jgi:cobalt-zinc-cadmium efflux system outer membrane protein
MTRIRVLSSVVCGGFLLGGAAAAAAAQRADAGQPLTIRQAIEEAIQHNLTLLAERSRLAVADAALVTARLRPNPVTSASADHLDWLGTGFNEVNNGGPPEYALRVDVPFERGSKRDKRIAVASIERTIAEAEFANAVRQLQMDVTLACVDVLAARATRTVVADTLHALEELSRVNRARVTAGAIPPVESMRADVAMLQFRANAVRAELDLATATARLRTLLGRPVNDPVELADGLGGPDQSPVPELARVQEVALGSRPDLRALQLGRDRSIADLRLQEAIGRIDYTVGAEYRRQDGVSGRSNSLGFFFSAPLPIWNRNQGEIARAGAQGDQAALQIDARRAEVQAEVQTAFHEFVTTRDLVAAMQRDLLTPATSARDIAAYTYRAGASSLLELLDAQRAFNDSMQSFLDAQASLRRAAARLNAAVGTEVVK